MTKITNITKGGRGLNLADGSKLFVNAGETVDVELEPAELKSLSKEWFKVGGGSAKSAAEVDEGDGDKGEAPTYKAISKGAGAYQIVDGEGTEVGEKITKKEADAFNALSDEDKVTHVLDLS